MSEAVARKLLWGAGALATVLFCLGPFAYMVAAATSEKIEFLRPGTGYSFTLDHLRTVLVSDSIRFPAYLANSLIVAALCSVISVAIASLAAYAFTRLPMPGKTTLLMAILAVSMFPPVSLVGHVFRALSAIGWVNTHQALILPYVAWTLPLSLWVLVSYFSQIPRDLDHAALIDGCSRLQVLLRVVLPVAAPGILSAALLAFVFAFNEFLFALVLTIDHAARTVPVGIAMFEGLHGEVPWGETMAAATVTTVPVVLLAFFFQRHIIQGLTRGAVKA